MVGFEAYVIIALLLVAIGLLVALLVRGNARVERQVGAALSELEHVLREELVQGRREQGALLSQTRTELDARLGGMERSLHARLHETAEAQNGHYHRMGSMMEARLAAMQKDNADKLEAMRQTVDEKLHKTLEERLGQSFRSVSERLEQVHRGLGEMQALAQGVGDLKRVLTNVKTRGNFGEVQLGSLLEQVLTPEQYDCNAATKPGSSERVEFALKLPGAEDGVPVYLPIDAKFPAESYDRLQDAYAAGDAQAVAAAHKELELALKKSAKDIREKYVQPPHTTDFAILFLPTEGLYAEALRIAGLVEWLQREQHVVAAGPTTLLALLNSLQMGFRTLAIERRSSEVWQVLGAVKAEFHKFGGVLEKTQEHIRRVDRDMDELIGTRTRKIISTLKSVEVSPATTPTELPGLD